MQAVKNKNSKIETALAHSLWALGYRYRKNDKNIYGKPDICFRKYKIAIFVDGEFWHGKNWEIKKNDHKSNQAFWHQKIERNIARDIEVNKKLLDDGWKVLRFWGKEIENNLRTCVEIIIEAINEFKRENNN